MGRSILALLTLACVITILLGSGLCANPLGVPDSEYNALVALYNSTDGPNWTDNTNWLTENPDWYGVDITGGHVRSLNLCNNNLTGPIPGELGNLANLSTLSLYDNHLSGSIPPQIGNLTNLGGLNLDYNDLTGSVPPELGNLFSAGGIFLGSNHLTGQIPAELGNLTNLQFLGLDRNQFSGPIPVELGNLHNLYGLYLDGNQFAGEVPSWITGLTHLWYLDVGYNCFTSTDPAVQSFLSMADPDWQYTQTVPPANVVAYNSGTGNALVSWTPIDFGQGDGYYEVGYSPTSGGPYMFDPANRTLDKWSSSLALTGLAPGQPTYFAVRTVSLPSFSNQSTLTSSVSAEATAGSNPLGIPESEYNALVAIYNSTNGAGWFNNTGWLSGSSYWYGVAVAGGHVVHLTLGANNLTGTLPAELGDLTWLYWLDLSGNHIGGPVPDVIGSLTNLSYLFLGWNQFSGPIPGSIGNLTNLFFLNLNSNALTGDIPSSITNLSALSWADLGYNALTCSDPAVQGFLSSVDCCWQYTQTVPPTNISAFRSGGSANVMWTPVQSNYTDGYYEIGYGCTPGGPYTFDPANRTQDKWSESLWIDGLDPNKPAYFVVRTVTPSHPQNQNTLTSANSDEVAAETLPAVSKTIPDGTYVWTGDVVITATFPDCCYIESEDRTWGIRVQSPEPGYPDPGAKAQAYGILRTNEDGERYLEVMNGYETGTGQVAPLGMTNKALGGGDFSYDPKAGVGQVGVTCGTGLNNIGLLVRTSGACTYVDDHTFTLDDGSGVGVTCITPPTILASPAWQYVAVTGASSIKKDGETYRRAIMVTHVDVLASDTPEGVTGRWEMTNTSGELAGTFGTLLVQQGSSVTGGACLAPIKDGQMNGNVFTCTFVPENGTGEVACSAILDGDTLTGTWTLVRTGESFPITFHRVSPDPMSPYVGRPKVVSARCNGWSLDVTWDRPVNGWDYDIRNNNGWSIVDWTATPNNTYDPDTYTYNIPIHTTEPMVPGEHYTICLESRGDALVDWHDPYGVAAWDWADQAYSFDFVYQQLPPPPSMILGYHTSGMPAQWVTISPEWPQGYGLRLYQSLDKVTWTNTGLIPTRRGGSGDFTFELWGNAYFRAVTVSNDLESPPSQKVHARPFEIETNGIVIDAPAEGATDVPIAPLISWHPAWTQSVTLQRYGPKVVNATTGSPVWNPLTTANPPQTSLLYGQIGGVQAGPATPLSPNTNYAIRLGAFDSENWMFATAPERHFTTTADFGGTNDRNAIAALYEATKNAMEAHDLNAMMALFSEDYLHNGRNRAAVQADMAEGIDHIASIDYEITDISFTGNKALVTASIYVTLDDESSFTINEPGSGGDGLGMGWVIQENGVWRFYGDQTRGQVELHTVRQPDGSYGLRFQAQGSGLVFATVGGPNSFGTQLSWDSTWNDYRQWVVPAQTPQIGDVYTFDLYYGDGRHETITSAVGSLVPVCPSVNAAAQPDGSIAINWQDISAAVPNASCYSVSVWDHNGYNFLWRSGDLGLGATGVVTPPLMPGTYTCEVDIFDYLDNCGTRTVEVTVGNGPCPPPL